MRAEFSPKFAGRRSASFDEVGQNGRPSCALWCGWKHQRIVWGVVIFGTAGLWSAVVSAAAIWRHQQFLSHRFDLGNMVQAVWSTTQGRPLEMTDGLTGEQIVRLGVHVDPILVLFAPVWMIVPHPETLIVGQVLALSAGLYPVVRLSMKHIGSRLAAGLLGLWYLAFPWLVWNAFNDFHPVTLAIPLILYAIWFLDQHRLGSFALMATLALMCGELIGITLVGLGIWYALSHRRTMVGLTIATLSAAWTVICIALVIPLFNEGQPSRYYDRFTGIGGSPLDVLHTMIGDPGAIIEQVTTRADALYVIWLVLPTAFLSLAYPVAAVMAAPQITVNLLSEWPSSTQPMFQYAAPALPGLIGGTIFAIARFRNGFRIVLAGTPLGMAILMLGLVPPLPGEQEFVFSAMESKGRVEALRKSLDLVPPSAPVMSTNRLGAHLSDRREVHLFPIRREAVWAVLDTQDPWLAIANERDDPRLHQYHLGLLERDANWRLAFEQQGIRVYQRVS